MSARRGKWHPPPPPSPRILHLPRRSRRARTVTKSPSAKPSPGAPPPETCRSTCGKLGSLLEQEQLFESPMRASVVRSLPGVNSGESAEEKWRIQAEILRAECNFLRMERGLALKKLERNRVQMESTLRSAVGTLASGRKKIDGSESVGIVLKKEKEELDEKLEELQGRRRERGSSRFESMDLEFRSGSGGNFDKKALILGKRLEEMSFGEKIPQQKPKDQQHGEETYVREIREITADTSGGDVPEKEHSGDFSDRKCQFHEVEMLRRKMEGISKGMLDRVEEYGSILSSSTAAAVPAGDRSPISNEVAAPTLQVAEEQWCTGRCREVVRRLVEQVRAETEQWAEMQWMLEQVREETEDLRCSRDFWERCAVNSDARLRTLNAQAMEWRQRAESAEHKASVLQKEVSELRNEIEELRAGEVFHLGGSSVSSLSSVRTRQESGRSDAPMSRGRQQQERSREVQREKEKRVLICRLNESSKGSLPRRSPLQEIGNLSMFFR